MKKSRGWLLLFLLMTPLLVSPAAVAEATGEWDHAWEFYTLERNIRCMLLSEDGSTLWIGAPDGLEEIDPATGRRTRFYPEIQARRLLEDGEGGLWIGCDNGLIHLKSDGARNFFDNYISMLPYNTVDHLALDDNGGVWVGTDRGVAHLKADGSWDLFTTRHSEPPRDSVRCIVNDGSVGVWIGWNGTPGAGSSTDYETPPPGLSHLTSDGSWELFDADNSALPSNYVESLLDDGAGGLWIGTPLGLAHWKSDGSRELFTTDNSALSNNEVKRLVDDGVGGLWIETEGGLNHLSADASWKNCDIVDSALSDGSSLYTLAGDGAGGLWAGKTSERLIHFTSDGAYASVRKNDFKMHGNNSVDWGDVVGDGAGGVWIHWDHSVTRLKSDGSLQIPLDASSSQAPLDIGGIKGDGAGGVWAITSEGTAHIQSEGSIAFYNSNNSEAPHDRVDDLIHDGAGGCWMATDRDLAHLKHDDSWDVYMDFPFHYHSDLQNDGAGGLWLRANIGEGESPTVVFVHVASDGSFTILDPASLGAPMNHVTPAINDGAGGLWFGTRTKGLFHYTSGGERENYNTDNCDLPSNWITDLVHDGERGLWIGTDSGLARLTSDGAWEMYNQYNSELPHNPLTHLALDDAGQLWIGTRDFSGYVWEPSYSLARLKPDGSWQVFDVLDSELPFRLYTFSFVDGAEGIWFDFGDHLARLSCDVKEEIARDVEDESLREEILTGSRAAIVLAAGAAEPGLNAFWRTSASMANHVYNIFRNRGYDHSEIHYASSTSWADFNMDGYNDSIVDAPVDTKQFDQFLGERDLTMDDVRHAFEWAESRGVLTQPLYVYIVGAGPEGRLMLSPSEALTGAELAAMIDEYQTAVGNEVVVIIESGRSEALISSLSGPNRVVIASSGGDELSQYDRTGSMSFTSAFLEPLGGGETLKDSLIMATQTMMRDYGWVGVTPSMDADGDGAIDSPDEWTPAGEIVLNGAWKTGREAMVVEPVEEALTVQAGSSAMLDVKVAAPVDVKEVQAVVRTPSPIIQYDDYGTPIMNNPTLTLTDQDGDGVYSGAVENLNRPGDYFITVTARDYKNNPARPAGITLTVEFSPSSSAWFTMDDDLNFTIPCIKANGVGHEVLFESRSATGHLPGLYWRVERETIRETENANCIDLGPGLELPVKHAAYMGLIYSFTLDFYINPLDPDPTHFYWKLNWETLTSEGPVKGR